MDSMVRARDLAKTYETNGTVVEAVKGIDLDVYRGEIFSLLGPNGAGKTTTISMISGLIEPTRGDAEIGGFSITKNPIKAKELLGIIPQEIALYPKMSARQNLEFFGRMYGLRGDGLRRSVDEMLEFSELMDRQHDRIDTYSGGMKRRVNIAAGLLHDPRVVYMDEPTVGIDPQSRRRILDTVMLLRDQREMTVLYTTHLMEEAQELSDRVAIIDHGEIIALGTQGELVQEVGELDHLVVSVGSAQVGEALLHRVASEIDGIKQAVFDPPGQAGEDTANASGKILVSARRGRKALRHVLKVVEEEGIEVSSVEVREPDLEAVFLRLTGRALRD